METALIKNTDRLHKEHGIGLINPSYLKELDEQREKSMLGQRDRLLAFHRYVYSMTDEEIKSAWEALREYKLENRKDFDEFIFLDTEILRDTLQFHLACRDENYFDFQTVSDIVKSYKENLNLGMDYPEIDSANMIKFLKSLILS